MYSKNFRFLITGGGYLNDHEREEGGQETETNGKDFAGNLFYVSFSFSFARCAVNAMLVQTLPLSELNSNVP